MSNEEGVRKANSIAVLAKLTKAVHSSSTYLTTLILQRVYLLYKIHTTQRRISDRKRTCHRLRIHASTMEVAQRQWSQCISSWSARLPHSSTSSSPQQTGKKRYDSHYPTFSCGYTFWDRVNTRTCNSLSNIAYQNKDR